MSFDDRAVEIVAWKVEVQGPVPGGQHAYRLRIAGTRRRRAARPSRRRTFPSAGGYVACPVYDRYALAPGAAHRRARR